MRLNDNGIRNLIARVTAKGVYLYVNDSGQVKVKSYKLCSKAERRQLAEYRDEIREILLSESTLGEIPPASVPLVSPTIEEVNRGKGCSSDSETDYDESKLTKPPPGYTYSYGANGRIVARNQIVSETSRQLARRRRRFAERTARPDNMPGFTLHYDSPHSSLQPQATYHGDQGVRDMQEDANRQIEQLKRR